MKNTQSKSVLLSALVSALLLQSSLSYADDTEIFIGAGAADVKPNVFFILDDSVSMEDCWDAEHRHGFPPRWHEDNNKNPVDWSQNWHCPGGKTNRMETLKTVMSSLLSTMENVNVGFMTLRGVHDSKPNNADGTTMKQWREQIVPVADIDSGGNRATLINKINAIQSRNLTPIVPSLYEAARYLTAIYGKHMSLNDDMSASPITEECQPTHMVLLTDGVANWGWKHIPDGVTPQVNDWRQDTSAGSNKSIHGPVSYQALPNQLHDKFKELLDTPVGAGHSSFPNPSWAGNGAQNRLCKMRGDWKWVAINEEHRDGGTTSDWVRDEYRYVGDTDCAVELASWLKTTDQAPKLNGNQTITTHTIGFALAPLGVTDSQSAQEFLAEVAAAGGGQSHGANTADELKKALASIMAQVQQVNSATFVNPGVIKNNFKQNKEHKDQVYYPLFRPTNSSRWEGNLKRYKLYNNGTDAVTLDITGKAAFTSNGAFASDAQSWWGIVPDGAEVAAGGVANQLPEPDARNLFVVLENTPKQAVLPELNKENDAIKPTMFGLSSDTDTMDQEERARLLSYIRGFSEDGKTPRKQIGDPLHSQASLFSYGCDGTVNDGVCNGIDKQMAVIGTNEGFIHMFDTNSGIEQWAIMPQELLKNIKTLRDNDSSSPIKGHPYGMDNTVTLWVNDGGDGEIEPLKGDHVYAYATMRRGGNGIYALDLTDPIKPKLLWQIHGGEGRFKRLGQTWSQPVKTQIKDTSTSGGLRDVLIFAGGYDENQDAPSHYRANAQLGNAIYIVDAKQGNLIWHASAADSDYNLAAMQYSIPGRVNVVSWEGEVAEQIFFADTGGQLWRLFINDAYPAVPLLRADSDSSTNSKKGIIGDFGGTVEQDQRRFYQGPDVALLNAKERSLYVNIGSGYRARPLNEQVQDRFYSIKIPANTDIGLQSDANLLDVTHRTAKSEAKAIDGDIKADNKKGWRFDLPNKGEKVMSTPYTAKGQIFFNSYVPGANANPCQAAIGANYSYRVWYANGLPGSPQDDVIERSEKSSVVGILGDTERFILQSPTGSGSKEHDQDACNGGYNCVRLPPSLSSGGKRTYWIDLQSE